jgi:hypothetical protein
MAGLIGNLDVGIWSLRLLGEGFRLLRVLYWPAAYDNFESLMKAYCVGSYMSAGYARIQVES